jgi:hypothetical protein
MEKKNSLLESLGERTRSGSDTGVRIVSGSPPITPRTSIVEKPATGMISRVSFEEKYFAETRRNEMAKTLFRQSKIVRQNEIINNIFRYFYVLITEFVLFKKGLMTQFFCTVNYIIFLYIFMFL